MNLFVRLMVFVIIAVAAAWGENAYLQSNSQETARLSVASVNGGTRELAELQQHEAGKNRSLLLTGVGVLAAGILLLGTYRPKPFIRYAPVLLLGGLLLGGCMKAYDKPEYQDVDTSETAFLTIEGDSTQTRAAKWDGRYPTWYFGGGAGNGAGMPKLMVNVPAPTEGH